jgi:cytochrome c-type biogenesis protein
MSEPMASGLSLYLQHTSILAFFAAYVGGLLVSFTPCSYPVIPLTIAVIGSHGSVSKMKGFALSVVYALGICVTYTILGAVAALSGTMFGQIQTNPWTYFIVGNIFLFMGLSMLEVFILPVRPPAFMARWQPKYKGLTGCFLAGILSGIFMSPCVAPVFAVLLGYVAAKQNLLFGMSLLFTFALGATTLLIVLGTFTSLITSLPKSGAWMVRIRNLSGWILLAMAEYFLIKAGEFGLWSG